jgi:hypothetical protein
MALDLTNLATFQANSRSANCASVGASFVTTFSSSRVTTRSSAVCISRPEPTRLVSMKPGEAGASGMRSTRTLAFFFA